MSGARSSGADGWDDQIEHEASLWAGRCEGGLSRRERAQLQAWLEADLRHADAFAEYRRLARKMEALRGYTPEGGRRAIGEPARPASSRGGSIVRFWPALAGAAALVLAAWWMSPSFLSRGVEQRHVASEAEVRSFALPDGSRVHLNASSEAVVNYGTGERNVTLGRGEAHFEVMPAPDRPFVVTVNGVRVRAVGTAFLVRRTDDEVEVVVTEGVVELSWFDGNADSPASEHRKRLEAGRRSVLRTGLQGAGYAPAGPVGLLEKVELDRRIAWKEGLLDFSPTPLREVLAQMNRYGGRRLRLADEALGDLSVGGSFRIGDEETFVLLMEGSFGLRAERRVDEIVLHGPVSNPAGAPADLSNADR